MKKAIWYILTLLVSVFAVIIFFYQAQEIRHFESFSSQITTSDIIKRLGNPHEIITPPYSLDFVGWDLPKVIPNNTSEIWIYDCVSGRRFYVFVDPSEIIISFFTSTS